MTQPELLARYDRALMRNFGPPRRVFVRGSGAQLWDAAGTRYVDLFSGIAVGGLGHAHSAVNDAVGRQLATLGHISNLFASEPQIELAERLASLAVAADPARQARVCFTNSGTEANEAAFKATRLIGRRKVIAMAGSFHGRTMGALALTSTPRYREPFEPLPGEVDFVPYGDLDALARVLDDRTAAVVVEPIQGESGVVVPPPGFLAGVREMTARCGALMWVDEVQTGIGRCGEWLCSVADGLTPDLITVAKGLGNGIPIGACIGLGRAADLFTPGSHGSTFSGNPVAAAAGLAVLDTIERDGLLARARASGARLAGLITQLRSDQIDQVRGRGLLLGIVLRGCVATQVADELLARGWIVNAPRPNVLRLAPPLVIAEEQLVQFVDVLFEVLGEAGNG